MSLEITVNADGVADVIDKNTEMLDTMEDEDSVEDAALLANVRQREDFTSEIYKIEISNMGSFGYGVCMNTQFY